MSERYITMSDLTSALEENRVKEMFGAGTACVVCPISKILYKGKVRNFFFPSFLLSSEFYHSQLQLKPKPSEIEKVHCLER